MTQRYWWGTWTGKRRKLRSWMFKFIQRRLQPHDGVIKNVWEQSEAEGYCCCYLLIACIITHNIHTIYRHSSCALYKFCNNNHVINWNEERGTNHWPWVWEAYTVDQRGSQDPTGESRCHEQRRGYSLPAESHLWQLTALQGEIIQRAVLVSLTRQQLSKLLNCARYFTVAFAITCKSWSLARNQSGSVLTTSVPAQSTDDESYKVCGQKLIRKWIQELKRSVFNVIYD